MNWFFYFLFSWIRNLFFPSKKMISKTPPVSFTDECRKYYQKQYKRFSHFLLLDCANQQTPTFFYKKEYYSSIDENHEITRLFQSKILIENTPFGNLIMFFDPVKLSFAYYSDNHISSYFILNAVAMKYCCTFFCCDFFVDETIHSSPLLSTLQEYYYPDNRLPNKNVEDEPIDPDYEKVKQNAHLFKFTPVVNQPTWMTEEKYKNRFVYLGRIRNFKPLPQKKKNVSKILFPEKEDEKEEDCWASFKKRRMASIQQKDGASLVPLAT